MKKILFSLQAIFFLFFIVNPVGAENLSPIYFFYGQGCPHCETVDQYFKEKGLYEKFNIKKTEIYFNRDNSILFNELLNDLNISPRQRGVPTVVVNGNALVGDKLIIQNFEKAAENKEEYNDTALVTKTTNDTGITLAAVIGASIVDAINPCAFAVLIILMSTILARGNGRKAMYSGIAFATSIFISYLLMGLGLYKALEFGGISEQIYKFIGWLALFLGLLNLKDYFWYGRGFLMEVPLSWRPKLKSLIKSVTSPLGAFFVGFLVSLFLLPCTSGPYIVILSMLAKNSFDTQALLYLFIYNLIFVSPMIMITAAVYKGFTPEKAEQIRQKKLKTLHLIAGIIMILMGVVIISGIV